MYMFCICICSAQLSMFHMERLSRNMPIIIIMMSCMILCTTKLQLTKSSFCPFASVTDLSEYFSYILSCQCLKLFLLLQCTSSNI